MARTRDAERFAEQRRLILKAAEASFVRSGFHATGIADICAAVGGMSPGRLYHYFPSKQAIVEALVAEERAATAALLGSLAEAEDIVAALADAVARATETVAGASYSRLALEILAEAGRNEAIAVIVREAAQDARAILVRTIRIGQERGEIGTGVDPEGVAGLITLLVDGAIGREMVDPGASSAQLAAQVRALAVALLTQGRIGVADAAGGKP